MIKPVPIRRLGAAGLVTDIPSVERSWQQMSRADNVRLEDGALATFGAFELQVDVGPGAVYVHPFFVSDGSGGHVVFYSDGAIKYFSSDADVPNYVPLDVTPVGYTPATDNWLAVQINDIFVAVNGGVPLQITEQQVNLGEKMRPMPNWPAQYTASLVANLGNFLVLAGITVDGIAQRAMLMWSHPLAPGDTEFFFYDRTDPTASLQLLAGENIITTAGRDIVGLQPLREALMIYLDASTWRMTFVGGAFVMSFAEVLNTDGATGPHAFAETGGRAIVCGYRDLYMHDGASMKRLGDGVITRSLYKSTAVRGAIVVNYPAREETYFFFRNTPTADATQAYVYRAGAFTRLLAPDGIRMAYVGPGFGRRTITYEQATDIYYNSTQLTYQGLTQASDQPMLIGLSGTGLYYLDPPASTAAHRPDLVYVEFDRADGDDIFGSVGDQIKTVSRLYPQVGSDDKGAADLVFDIGVSQTSRGPLVYERSITFRPDLDVAVDTRQSGRYFSMRLRLRPGETRHLYLTGMDAELILTGRQ